MRHRDPQPGSSAGQDPADAGLRALLATHTVPEPSPDFVDDTLLRLRLAAARTPPAPAGFVDRVMEALAADPVVGGRMQRAPAPVLRRRWPLLVSGLLAAAALVVALVPRPAPAPMLPLPQLADLVAPARFPLLGGNTVTRSFSLARQAAAAAQDPGRVPGPAAFYFPPPPSLAADAGALDDLADPWAEGGR